MKSPAIAVFLSLSLTLQGQDTIRLQNPSFETDMPACGQMPAHWINRTDEAVKDGPMIAPGCDFGAVASSHGERYMCLKARKKLECDQIGQRLNDGTYLEIDSTYRISLYLAYSEDLSVAKQNGKSFGKPAVLRVWGISHIGKDKELLYVTQPVNHAQWRKYDLILKPVNNDYDEIIFEAFYDPDQSFAYNGNVLIDNISGITKVPYKSRQVNGRPARLLRLNNPSFEDTRKCCDPPAGWYNCGPSDESPTDIQPGMFQVTLPARDGDTYLGMVVRDNNTVEAIGQRLPELLRIGKQYLLRAHLARSEMYLSLSRATGDEANYATPVMLRVWGGSESSCDRRELLGQTPLVTTSMWREYELFLEPQYNDYEYLILEAYYKTPVLFPYNGNLLVDNLSLHLLEN